MRSGRPPALSAIFMVPRFLVTRPRYRRYLTGLFVAALLRLHAAQQSMLI